MEVFILIAVVRWFSGIARTADRSPLAWGSAGAVAYVSGLSVSALIVGPLFSATLGDQKSGLAFVLYFALINAAGLALANLLCRGRFNKNLTTMKSLARIPNVGAIVVGCSFLIPELIELFQIGNLELEKSLKALLMAGLLLVLSATLFVLRNGGDSATIAAWPAFIVLSVNAILAVALLWYSTTWVLSQHSGAMSMISAYIVCWSILAAGLNVLCIGLTIRSSRA